MPLFDAVASHNYWSSAGLTQWNALRWRLFPRPAIPIYVTECGRDRVRDGPNGTYLPPGDGPAFGWQAQGITAEQYLAELAAFDAECRADGVYGLVFTGSPDDGWSANGFSIDAIADRCHGFTHLGPHDLLGSSPQSLDWAAVAPIVKSCDQTAAIRRARPGAVTVYRRRFTPAEQDDMLERGDYMRLVTAIDEGLAGWRHPQLYVELLNEVGRGRRAQYLRLARAAVPILRRAALRVIGPSWATGDYDDEDWRAFALGEGTVPDTKGIDVSNHQGDVDLGAVKAAGYEFAFFKASGDEGARNVYFDPTFAANWQKAQDAGMVRGAYHYAKPSRVSPSQSVTTLQRAVQAVGGLRPGDLVALDAEDPDVPNGQSLHVWKAEWLSLAEQVFGVIPWKYSAKYYTMTHDLEHDDLSRYPTWWASSPPEPAPRTGWGPIRIWQHDWFAAVPGVAGNCDVNVFHGTVADLKALGLAPPPAADWEIPVLGPIYRGASAVGGMPDKEAADEADAAEIIRYMDAIKARHPA